MTTDRPSAEAVASLLCGDCEQLFRELVPDAHFDAGEMRGHAPDGGVVSMAVRGPKRGRWSNWNTDKQSGDPLDLVAWMRFGGNLRQGYAWACRRLGITSRSAPVATPAVRPVPKARCRGGPVPASQALNIYRRGVENSPAVSSYLASRLGGPLDQLLPELPQGLRFVSVLRQPGTGAWLSAMAAPVINPVTLEHIATHATFLAQRDHTWRKVLDEPRKATWGSYTGGVIPLLRGASNTPLQDVPPGETVLIAEGIENALAAAVLRVDRPRVWAGVSNGNLKNLVLPRQIARAVIVEDNDEANASAARTLKQTIERLLDAGHAVEWMRAPSRFKDMAEFVSSEFGIVGVAGDERADRDNEAPPGNPSPARH